MVRSNEPDGLPPPRVLLCFTPEYYLLRFGATVPDALSDRITSIVRAMWAPGGLRVPPALAGAVGTALGEELPVGVEESGPIFRFPDSLPPTGDAVQLVDANLSVARDTYPWLCAELALWGPCFAVVRDGAATSVCFSSRIGAEANEAGVDTRPGFRGRGFATATTAAWGAAVKAAGRTPLYSTSWENQPSRGLANRLRLVMFGAEVNWW